jgi:hypothetical protein
VDEITVCVTELSGSTGPVIVESPLGNPCIHYIQALNKNEELLNSLNFIFVRYEKEQTTRVCHLRRLTIY